MNRTLEQELGALLEATGGRLPDFADTVLLSGVTRALDEIPELDPQGGKFIGVGGGSNNLVPLAIMVPLVVTAVQDGPAAAAAWLQEVLRLERADIDLFAEIRGIQVPPSGVTVGDIRLFPWEHLPDTAVGQSTRTMFYKPGTFPMAPPTVATLRILDVFAGGAKEQFMTEDHRKAYEAEYEKLQRSVGALTGALDGPWSIGRFWYDFASPSMQKALQGHAWQEVWQEAPVALGVSQIGPEHAQFAGRYLAIGDKRLGKKLDIASQRLNLARRRMSVGNKAIEASIALEALLGDDRFDLTYKLGLRAALLLGGRPDERRRTAETVRRFYKLRGDVVHGTRAGDVPADRTLVDQAIDIVARLLRRLVDIGRAPDWTLLELTAGVAL